MINTKVLPKTPTSIYLAQWGVKTINIPLVPGLDLPPQIFGAKRPIIVALVATAERILAIRENRLLAFDHDLTGDIYVDWPRYRKNSQQHANCVKGMAGW